MLSQIGGELGADYPPVSKTATDAMPFSPQVCVGTSFSSFAKSSPVVHILIVEMIIRDNAGCQMHHESNPYMQNQSFVKATSQIKAHH